MASVVHVWSWRLDLPSPRLDRLAGWLNPAERERAARFRFPRHRDAFIAARGTLRHLIGSYVDCPPAAVEFTYGFHGKPSTPGLKFNLSHSGDWALAAFAWDFELGIDLETPGRHVDLQVARRFFSAAETDALFALPEHQRQQAFLRIWTRKEAVIKAYGQGLSLPLGDFDVTLEPDSARLTRCLWDPAAPAAWSLRDLSSPGHYLAALAVPAPAFELVRRQVAEDDGSSRPGGGG